MTQNVSISVHTQSHSQSYTITRSLKIQLAEKFENTSTGSLNFNLISFCCDSKPDLEIFVFDNFSSLDLFFIGVFPKKKAVFGHFSAYLDEKKTAISGPHLRV